MSSAKPLNLPHWQALAMPSRTALFGTTTHSDVSTVLSVAAYVGDCAMADLENSEPDILQVPRSESPPPATPTETTRVRFEGVAPHPGELQRRATESGRKRSGDPQTDRTPQHKQTGIPGVSPPPPQAGKGELTSGCARVVCLNKYCR